MQKGSTARITPHSTAFLSSYGAAELR